VYGCQKSRLEFVSGVPSTAETSPIRRNSTTKVDRRHYQEAGTKCPKR
jgi:hypothetical protein